MNCEEGQGGIPLEKIQNFVADDSEILSILIFSHKFLRVNNILLRETTAETGVYFVNLCNSSRIYGITLVIIIYTFKLSIIPLASISIPSSLSKILLKIYLLCFFR